MRWRRKRRKGMAVAGQQADVGALRQAESPAQRGVGYLMIYGSQVFS